MSSKTTLCIKRVLCVSSSDITTSPKESDCYRSTHMLSTGGLLIKSKHAAVSDSTNYPRNRQPIGVFTRWMMRRARQHRPHLQVLHRHMTGALIVPQPIAVESIDLHSLHPMLFHPLLLLALRCHFATSLISACPQPHQHSPCEHDDTLHGKRTFLTLSSKRTKGAAFVPQLRVVLHPFLTFIRRAMLRSGRQTQIDVQSNMKVLQTQ